jgi:23S rRNA (adenine1618-N6)-methyltransferase
MSQGQKQSRLLAWTFLDKKQRRAWRKARWPQPASGA